LFVHAEDPSLVCSLDDRGNELRNFGERGHGSNTRDTLWDFRGRFSVYATMFYVGQHVAWRPQDFIPVVNHLLWLHQDGFVHGDIRCCNIVFRMDEQGRLIDYDFGGRITGNHDGATPTYPPGYNFFGLADGVRLGTEGGAMTMRKDWFAMHGVIFKCHDFRRPRRLSTGDSDHGPAQATLDSDTFLDMKDEFFAFSEQEVPDNLEEIKEHAKALTVGRRGWMDCFAHDHRGRSVEIVGNARLETPRIGWVWGTSWTSYHECSGNRQP
jgi:serine/threonine protein kinase